MKRVCILFCLMLVVSLTTGITRAGEIRAYYTKVDSGQEFEKYSRTGPYADIVIEVKGGKFVFWRGSSYLPYWQSDNGKWFVDQIIPRSGDGPANRPDKVNTYSRVFLIESTPEKAVVLWRYLPQFGGKNPHTGVDATKFVEETFVITSDGKVVRTIRKGTAKIDQWRDPLNRTVQTFKLTSEGFADKKLKPARLSKPAEAIAGNPAKRGFVVEPVRYWTFDEGRGDVTTESATGTKCEIAGHKSLWKKGVSGTALEFDGYTSLVTFPSSKAPKITDALTLEGWVVIGAYPWSWTPIVQQCDDVEEILERMEGPRAFLTGEEEREEMEEPSDKFTFVLKKEDDVGYFLGLDGFGHPSLKLRVGNSWEELVSDVHLERRRWYHVVGTYDGKTGLMKLYVDGKPAGAKQVAKGEIELSSKDIKIGQGKPRRPIKPVRANTFKDIYSFDGLIDEVRIYDVSLSPSQVAQSYAKFRPSDYVVNNPDMDKRVLPEGKNTGKFGAYYTHLKFYETWDNLWRFGDWPDVVVEFDELPTKFVFWRGVGYIPMLVNDKGQWYTNEFNETWNKSGGQGCQEPMSDKESYTNHARIIENTPARVVVHWRYPLVDVLHVIANYNADTGWGDWSDWYYYIYPDGVAVKTMHLWTDGERNHEWQESIAVFGPDQHPEQVIETAPALIMADLNGRVDKYDWVNGPPDEVDYDNMKIHIVNYHSDYDPVTIGNFLGGNVYGGELTDYAVFPTWNHWPVGQMPSDGRYAIFPDRTGHSSLTHVFMPTYKEQRHGPTPYQEKLLMEGMSNLPVDDLVPLAKSWLKPAKLVEPQGCTDAAYERGQRAYLMAATDSKISFKLRASQDTPVINPCFVVSNWGGENKASLTINGRPVRPGRNFRQGIIIDSCGKNTMVIWVKYEADSPIEVTITGAEPQRD